MGRTVRGSGQSALFRQLGKDMPALLRRRTPPTELAKPGQTQRRLTTKQVEELIVQYQAGDDMKTLATRWGLHRTTVAALLGRAGVNLRRRGIPSDQVDEAVAPYADGWSCQRLAERYDCDDETVRQTLKRAGVGLRVPWQRLELRAATLTGDNCSGDTQLIRWVDEVPPIPGRWGRPRRRLRKKNRSTQRRSRLWTGKQRWVVKRCFACCTP